MDARTISAHSIKVHFAPESNTGTPRGGITIVINSGDHALSVAVMSINCVHIQPGE
jgi:hypothetical protein